MSLLIVVGLRRLNKLAIVAHEVLWSERFASMATRLTTITYCAKRMEQGIAIFARSALSFGAQNAESLCSGFTALKFWKRNGVATYARGKGIMSSEDVIDGRIESKALPDGRGGLFVSGELVAAFATEADSDEAGIALARILINTGIAKQEGQAYRDGKPYDLANTSAQPDAQAEAPQQKVCPNCNEAGLGCDMFGCWRRPKERTIDTSDAEPWPDEVFTAPAEDVPANPHDNFRPDLAHKFKSGYDAGRCAHWFKWLGGDVMCGCSENHPLHPKRNVSVDREGE